MQIRERERRDARDAGQQDEEDQRRVLRDRLAKLTAVGKQALERPDGAAAGGLANARNDRVQHAGEACPRRERTDQQGEAHMLEVAFANLGKMGATGRQHRSHLPHSGGDVNPERQSRQLGSKRTGFTAPRVGDGSTL